MSFLHSPQQSHDRPQVVFDKSVTSGCVRQTHKPLGIIVSAGRAYQFVHAVWASFHSERIQVDFDKRCAVAPLDFQTSVDVPCKATLGVLDGYQ
jgi:hypothetical protein